MTSSSRRTSSTFQFIAIKNLSVIWVQAQRPFNETWAKKIADDFDPDKFDPPVVTKPNGVGVFHVVEGQHRINAAKIAFGELEQINCRVVDADDPARAAEIWLGINSGRKAIKPVQKFIVSVTAEREPEREINKIVEAMGYKVGLNKSAGKTITAVSSMIDVHRRLGSHVLKAVLVILDKTWNGDNMAFQGDLIRGYAVFLNEFGPYVEPKRLAEVVSSMYSPGQLMSAAKLYTEQDRAATLTTAISEKLRTRYNFKLKDEAKLKRK